MEQQAAYLESLISGNTELQQINVDRARLNREAEDLQSKEIKLEDQVQYVDPNGPARVEAGKSQVQERLDAIAGELAVLKAKEQEITRGLEKQAGFGGAEGVGEGKEAGEQAA